MTEPYFNLKAKLDCGAVIEFTQYEPQQNITITVTPADGLPISDTADIKDNKLVIRATIESFIGIANLLGLMVPRKTKRFFWTTLGDKMKKITVPKTKLFGPSDIFYVPSKSGGDRHIVVRAGASAVSQVYFCDCKDFMTRRLPLLGTSGFSLCSHGIQVRDRKLTEKKKTYAVFTPGGYRSSDLRREYPTLKAAQDAIENHEHVHGRYGRVARAL